MAACVAIPTAPGQPVVSVRAGLLIYAEGSDASIKTGRARHGRSIQLLDDESLTTDSALIEMQLSATSTLRVAKASQVRMISGALDDTKLAVEKGAVIVEIIRWVPGTRLRIQVGDVWVEPRKEGVYRIDWAPRRLRVYGGESAVQDKGGSVEAVKPGRAVDLLTGVQEKFNRKKDVDLFHTWAAERSFRTFAGSAGRRINRYWERQVGGLYRHDAFATACQIGARRVRCGF